MPRTKFKIIVKPNSRRNEVSRSVDGTLMVYVSEPPFEGRANERVIELLSEYLKKPRRSISIVAGLKGKVKIIQID